MKKWRLLWRVLKRVDADKILIGFVIFVFTISFFILLVEPSITLYKDAVWYSFTVVSTIGFGDIVAATPLGRIMTMVLSMYGIVVIALIPGIIVSFYTEFMQIKANESTEKYLEKLENLENLSKEELRELSTKIKNRRYKL